VPPQRAGVRRAKKLVFREFFREFLLQQHVFTLGLLFDQSGVVRLRQRLELFDVLEIGAHGSYLHHDSIAVGPSIKLGQGLERDLDSADPQLLITKLAAANPCDFAFGQGFALRQSPDVIVGQIHNDTNRVIQSEGRKCGLSFALNPQ
jgi:hypothetical protein